MFAEVRLRTGADLSGITILRSVSGLAFDSKNGDIGSISFNIPLADAQSLGVDANTVIEIQPNGLSVPNMWFGLDSSQYSQTVDGASLRALSGKSLINWLGDGIVYPSTWHYATTPSDYTVTSAGSRTSVVPRFYIVVASTGISIAASTDVITTPAAHSLSVNDTVQFATISGAAGLVANRAYYVKTVPSSTTFTVSATVGGSVVNITSNGTATGLTKTTTSGDTSLTTINGHAFSNATPGFILRTLVARCVERGGMAWLDVSSFTGPTATSGNPWNTTLTTTYTNGTTLLQVIQDLATRGLIEFHMDGNALKVYNVGESVTHWTPDQITFRRGQQITEQTRTLDSSNTVDTVLIAGDALAIGEMHDTSITPTLGRRREKYVSQGGITDIPTLVTLMGGAELSISGHILTEDSLGIADNAILPWKNFQNGDWVWADFDGTLKNIQIQQISATAQDAGNLQLGLTLGDVISAQDEKNQRLLDNITGQSAGSYGGLPNQDTGRPPSDPSSVVATPTPYRDSNGRDLCQVSVTWTQPTTNIDGTALTDLNRYELQYQIGTSTLWTDSANIPASNAVIAGFISALASGVSFVCRVRAVNTDGHASNWITSNTIATLPKVVVTPPTPSTPSTAASLGGMTISWDGKDSSGNSMDSTFAQANVYLSTSSSFTPGPATLINAFTSAGKLTVNGLAYGTTYYAAFIIVDKSGNMSAASAISGGVTPTQVTSSDISNNSVTTAMIQAGAVTGAKIASATIPSSAVNFTARNIGGNTTFTQSATPTGAVTGDLWIDTGNGNVVKTYNGTAWVANQLSTAQLSGTISAAQAGFTARAIGSNTSFVSATTPTGAVSGDTWIDTSNGNTLKQYNGSTWGAYQVGPAALNVVIGGGNVLPDSSFENSITGWTFNTGGSAAGTVAQSTAQAMAPGTHSIVATTTSAAGGYVGPTYTVSGLNVGQTYTFSAWVYVPTAFTSSVTVGQTINGLTFGTSTAVKNTWTRLSVTFVASAASGALFVVTPNGVNPGSGLSFYADNVQLELGNVPTSYAAKPGEILPGTVSASQVNFTARSIGGTTTFTQSATPTGAVSGDLWIDTGNGNVVKTYNGTAWVTNQLSTAQLAGQITAAQAAFTARTIGSNITYVQSATPTGMITGDLWVDTGNGNVLKQYNGTAWTAYAPSAGSLTGTVSASQVNFTARAIGGTTTFTQSTTPTGAITGDLWVDTANGNVIKTYNGSSWVVNNLATSQLSGQITAAQAAFTARQIGSTTTFTQSATPTGAVTGDLWIDTGNGNVVKTYNGTAWVANLVGDAAISGVSGTKLTAGSVPSTAVSFTARNIGGTTTFTQSATPTGAVTGDLWIDTGNGNVIKTYNGTSWVVNNLATAQLSGTITAAQAGFTARQIGSTTTFTQSATPTGAVTNDLWIDTGNGNVLKQYNGTAWVNVQDAAVATASTNASNAVTTANNAQTTANNASTAASNAQTTANGKNKIYRQSTQPTGATAGDTWFDTSNGNRVSIYDGSAWQLSQLQGVAVGNLDAGSITTGSLAAARIAAGTITGTMIAATTITAGNIAANTITAGQIAANTITAGQIAANTITASQIAASTITATQIATGTITATQIQAGSLTGDRLAANTITATQIAANTITAAQIAAGTITATQIAANTITANKLLVTIGGGNLSPDSSFESGTVGGWSNGGSSAITLVNSTTQFWPSGFGTGHSLSATATATITGGDLATAKLARAIDTVVPGNSTVTISAYVLAPSGLNFKLGLENIAFGTTIWTGTGSWQRVYQTISTGTSASYTTGGLVSIPAGSSMASGAVVYVDAVQIELGDVVTAWSPKPNEILPGTVVANMIASNTITATQIASNTITGDRLVANTITATQIATGTITASQIAAGTITATQIASATITGDRLVANTITASQIATGTITAAQIQSGTITGTQIAGTTITGSNIAAGTIAAGNIVSGTITATQIAAGSITGDRLTANTVTATQIAANTITASQIAAGTITATQIATGAITAQKLSITVGGGNLVTNSSMGNGVNGYASWSAATLAADSTVAFYGTTSAKVTATNTTGCGIYVVVSGLTPNTTYTFSAWNRLPASGGTPAVYLSAQNYGGANTVSTTTLTTTGVWTRQFTTFTTGSSNTSVYLYAYALSTTVGQYFNTNAFQLEIGDTPTSYAPKVDEILPGTVVANMIAANTITASQIAAGTITSTQIATGTIVAGNIQSATITGAQIAATTITASNIAANTITAGQIAAGTITTNQIAANTITGTNLAVNTITTNNLTVSAFGDSVAPNGSFEDTSTQPAIDTSGAAGWKFVNYPGATGTATVALNNNPTNSSSGSNSIAITLPNNANAGAMIGTTTPVPTTQGDIWFVSFRIQSTVSIISAFSAVASLGDTITEASTLSHTANGTNIAAAAVELQPSGDGPGVSAFTLPTTWTTYEVAVTVPNNGSGNQYRYMSLFLGIPTNSGTTAATIYIDNVSLRPVGGSATISKLSASRITAGSLSSDVVIGARLKTADTGARVELNSAGLLAYDVNNNQTVNIASADGSVQLAGTLQASNVSNTTIGSSQIISSNITGTNFNVDNTGGQLFLYGSAAPSTQTITTTGAGTWTAPTGVTAVTVEAWGGGAGGEGSGYSGGGGSAGNGGGGGEYAKQTIAVTPGTVYNYTVGAGGAGGTRGTSVSAGGFGGNTTFAGDSTSVVANGGSAYGSGGSGSSNTIHFAGGSGGDSSDTFYYGGGNSGGGGGGSSAGTASAGKSVTTKPTSQYNATTSAGTAGGAAVTGGGAGGAGGSANSTSATAGTAGSAPGAGGGAGGFGSGASSGVTANGGAGARGQIRLTWITGTPAITAVISATAGTDSYGNSYVPGVRILQSAGGYDSAWRLIGGSGQPAFASSWANYGGAYQVARFYKDAMGYVHLSGLIKSGTFSTTSTIFTLPAGYRPSATQIFYAMASSMATVRIDITTAGTVTATSVAYVGSSTSANVLGTNAYLSLDTIPPFLGEV